MHRMVHLLAPLKNNYKLMENYKLASADNLMAARMPFWPEDWLENLPDGAKLLLIPPLVELGAPLEIELPECGDFLIAVGEGAKVQISETTKANLEFVNKAQEVKVRVFVSKDAVVDYFADETEFKGNGAVVQREAVLDAGSAINWYGASLAQDGFKSETRTWLRGEKARSNYHWLVNGRDRQTVDFKLINAFDAPNCTGQIFIKSVAQDAANLAITGQIDISLQAGGTDSYLKQDSLLLDPQARVRTMPCLEIKTNDVKAGHGATVTNFTDEDLFYLRSRGVDVKTAKQLMVTGFLESVLANCPNEAFLEKAVSLI